MKRRPKQTMIKPADGDLYLDLEAVQLCDVLLELGAGKESRQIARFTGGPFSHSALVVSRYFLFESDDVGLGYTPLRVDRVERHASGKRVLARLEGVEAAVVLRHPGLDAATAKLLEDDLAAALGLLRGMEYPKWIALATALPGGWSATQLGRVALWIKDNYDGTDVWNPGPFCSQLVTGVLMDVLPSALRVFVPKRDPRKVNPNTLLDSQLAPIAGAVRCADSTASIDAVAKAQYDLQVGPTSRDTLTGPIVEFTTGMKKNDKQIDQIAKRIAQANKGFNALRQRRLRQR